MKTTETTALGRRGNRGYPSADGRVRGPSWPFSEQQAAEPHWPTMRSFLTGSADGGPPCGPEPREGGPPTLGLYWRTLRHLRARQIGHFVRHRLLRPFGTHFVGPGWISREWLGCETPKAARLKVLPEPPDFPEWQPALAQHMIETGEFRFLNFTVPSLGRIPWAGSPGRPFEFAQASTSAQPALSPVEGRGPVPVEGQLPRLWIYHLNYCDFLNVELTRPRDPSGACLRAALRMALDWCEQNATGTEPGWEPYPTSLRVVNWLKFLLRNGARAETLGEGAVLSCLLASLRVQTLALEKRLEKDLLANHLLKNAKALMFAGALLDVPEGGRWWTEGQQLLEREMAEQILEDGGHFERSPMYHAQVLEDLLDLEALSRSVQPAASNRIRLIYRVGSRMASFLRSILHPDGEIPLFNDSALGVAPPALELLARAEAVEPECPDVEAARQDGLSLSAQSVMWLCDTPKHEKTPHPPSSLGHPLPLGEGYHLIALPSPLGRGRRIPQSRESRVRGLDAFSKQQAAKPLHRHTFSTSVLPDTGYGVLRDIRSESCLVFDAGPLGPDYQPGHGHCDLLSYELSLEGQRVVVDTGTSTYEAGTNRHYERSTAAHNTLRIDREEQAEIWASFRVGARPKEVRLQAGEVRGLQFLGGEYATRERGVVHSRTVLHLRGNCWVIVDNLRGGGLHRAESYVHFHPAVGLETCANGASPIARDGAPDGEMRRQAIVSLTRGRYLLVTWGMEDLKLAQGWYAPEFGLRLASRVLYWTWEGKLPKTTVYAFVPADGRPPIINLGPEGKAIEINHTIVPLV